MGDNFFKVINVVYIKIINLAKFMLFKFYY